MDAPPRDELAVQGVPTQPQQEVACRPVAVSAVPHVGLPPSEIRTSRATGPRRRSRPSPPPRFGRARTLPPRAGAHHLLLRRTERESTGNEPFGVNAGYRAESRRWPSAALGRPPAVLVVGPEATNTRDQGIARPLHARQWPGARRVRGFDRPGALALSPLTLARAELQRPERVNPMAKPAAAVAEGTQVLRPTAPPDTRHELRAPRRGGHDRCRF
jgi:hypothetical protein